MFIILAILFILSATNAQLCKSARNETGDCMKITQCVPMFKILQNKPISPSNFTYLLHSQCGFRRRIPKVCCPFEMKDTLNVNQNNVGVMPKDLCMQMSNVSRVLETCKTQLNEPGHCVKISQCNKLFKILQNRPISLRNARYLLQAQCGVEGRTPKVCCPEPEKIPDMDISNDIGVMPDILLKNMCNELRQNQTITSKDSEVQGKESQVPLPAISDMCGIQTIQHRILGGQETIPGEFPWSALLVYHNKLNVTKLLCGGVLINRRFILTAAHCINSDLRFVRLGEYDIEHAGEDCVKTDTHNICSSPSIDVPIQQTIVYPKFNPSTYHNDVALIKLNTRIQFNDYIRPICLPSTTKELVGHFSAPNFVIAGWGCTENYMMSTIKLKLKLKEYPFDKCGKRYASFRYPFMPNSRVTLESSQFCAGGTKGKDSCHGDSGGSLMAVSLRPNGNLRWVSAGVVSFSATPFCGVEDNPAVYTKVWNFMEWIKTKIKE